MSYVWCCTDGWRCCFNVIDVLPGGGGVRAVWQGHAPRGHMAVNNAVAAARPPPGRALRVDNGSQYAGRGFRQSASALGITLEYTCVNTPEQNGHARSFHKTLKKSASGPSANPDEAREAVQDAFWDYNCDRIHSAPGHVTPSEFSGLWQQCEAGAVPGDKRITGGEKRA